MRHFWSFYFHGRTSSIILASCLIFDVVCTIFLHVENRKQKRKPGRVLICVKRVRKGHIGASLENRRVPIAIEKKITLLCVILSTHFHSDAIFSFFWSICKCRLYLKNCTVLRKKLPVQNWNELFNYETIERSKRSVNSHLRLVKQLKNIHFPSLLYFQRSYSRTRFFDMPGFRCDIRALTRTLR